MNTPNQQPYPTQAEVSPSTPSKEDEAAHSEAEGLEQTIAGLAEQLKEAPTKLRKRTDVTQVLERMTDGVIVTLHIGRPRFSASIAPKRGGSAFGLEKLGITHSEHAEQVIQDYFALGRHSLLPTELQRELASIETAARLCLERYSFRTHWGFFLPTANYGDWKAENDKHEHRFWEKKTYVLDHYDEILEEVIAAYRTLAEDAWMHSTFGTMILRDRGDHLSKDAFDGLYQRLSGGRGKEEFIEGYLSAIRGDMPNRNEVTQAFVYEVELGYIPLPSLLARDMDEADHIIRARALRDAQLRAEMEAIEAQRRTELDAAWRQQQLDAAKQQAELDKLNQQQRAERELAQRKLQVEQEKIERQRAMDRDVLAKARQQKDQLIQEFRDGIIAQINELIFEVCEQTLHSLDKQEGTLRGPVSERLRDLVRRLEHLNFLEDEQVDQQIAQLRSVLPTHTEREEARRGIAKIDTTHLRKVVEQLREEAENTLLELELGPMQRKRRQIGEIGEDLLLDEQATRRHRPAGGFGKEGTATKRRSRITHI